MTQPRPLVVVCCKSGKNRGKSGCQLSTMVLYLLIVSNNNSRHCCCEVVPPCKVFIASSCYNHANNVCNAWASKATSHLHHTAHQICHCPLIATNKHYWCSHFCVPRPNSVPEYAHETVATFCYERLTLNPIIYAISKFCKHYMLI